MGVWVCVCDRVTNLKLNLENVMGCYVKIDFAKVVTRISVLGDEFHFVMECSRYSDIREKLLPPKYTSVKFTFNLCNLFSASKNIQLKFAKCVRLGKVT